jgi:hypothetical protein
MNHGANVQYHQETRLMTSTEQIFLVTQAWKRRAWMDPDAYRKAYQRSLRDPEGFCAEQAMRLDWPNSRSAPP